MNVLTDAIKFAVDVRLWSRTAKAAKLRLLAAQHLVTGKPTINEIVKRAGVTRQRAYQAINDIKKRCGLS